MSKNDMLQCVVCNIFVKRDSEEHDNCSVINDGEDVVCVDCRGSVCDECCECLLVKKGEKFVCENCYDSEDDSEEEE
jgi:hypothetical protein